MHLLSCLSVVVVVVVVVALILEVFIIFSNSHIFELHENLAFNMRVNIGFKHKFACGLNFKGIMQNFAVILNQ